MIINSRIDGGSREQGLSSEQKEHDDPTGRAFTQHHIDSDHSDDDDDEEEEEEREQDQEEKTQDNQSLLRTHSSEKRPDPSPCSTSSFLIASIVALGLFLTFFISASSISKSLVNLKHTAGSKLGSSSKFIKPVGPPGSITDKTDHWASQGGAWKNVDLNPELKIAQNQAELSNGTHKFKKTVILVSLDGFRADYLDRGLTPRLTTIKEKFGISADFLKPQFPSLTFPNHWSILTGLYPESHGIVANEFRDPKLGKSFSNVDPHKSWDSIWWSGDPIWAIATKNKIRTAISMWPGPPYTSDKTRPTYWRAFEDRYKWWKKIRQLENWLDLSVQDRPQLIALYVPDVDQMGHLYGPDHPKLNQTIRSVDKFVGSLYDTLERRNLLDIVDVIYLGDHGMMATSDSRIVYLDKILGSTFFELIQFQDGWPAAGLRFPSELDTGPILERLIEQSKILPGFEVYTHQTMPQRWHFTNNERIAPIYVIPKPGWVISSTHEHEVIMNGTYNVRGVHGYDNDEVLMRSIFVGHGPFAQQIKSRQLEAIRQARHLSRDRKLDQRSDVGGRQDQIVVGKMNGFSNLEIFSLVSRLLNLDGLIDFSRLNCSSQFWDPFF